MCLRARARPGEFSLARPRSEKRASPPLYTVYTERIHARTHAGRQARTCDDDDGDDVRVYNVCLRACVQQRNVAAAVLSPSGFHLINCCIAGSRF